MVRPGSDYIIERLTQVKVAKEYVKGNKVLLDKFSEYLESALKALSGVKFGEISYFVIPELLTPSTAKKGSTKNTWLMCKVFTSWDGSLIVKKSVKGFSGVLFGLDLSKFDAKKSIYFDSSIGVNRFFYRRVARYIQRFVTLKEIQNVSAVLLSCKGHLDRREVIANFLDKKGFNISYINKVYHNDLEEFFLDGLVGTKYVHRNMNWPDKLTIPEKAGFNDDFFKGPYGETFLSMVYDDAVANFYKDFDSFRVYNDLFKFLKDDTFVPWVFVSFDNMEKDEFAKELHYYSVIKYAYANRGAASFSAILSGDLIDKYEGFFDGRVSGNSVGNPFESFRPVSKSRADCLRWD